MSVGGQRTVCGAPSLTGMPANVQLGSVCCQLHVESEEALVSAVVQTVLPSDQL